MVAAVNLGRMIGLALVSEIVVGFGDIMAKRWSSNGGRGPLVAAAVSYVFVSMLWLAVLKASGGQLGRAAIFWAATGTITPVLLGRFWFGEAMSWTSWLGMAFCSVGLVLNSLPGK